LDSFVGSYRILRLIKRGGQGSVYLGYDKRLHRKVAIKIYRLPETRRSRRQLLREARLVASIQSPKVVQIHDVIESGTHLALVMEYVPGCSLEEFLAAARPSLGSVLTVGVDIAGALALARQAHIVHGDVKAANVLITEAGRAKLTDFGISRKTAEGAPGQWRAGSVPALSPEQFLAQPLDERADLFALGALLYRMLGGEHPFHRDGRLDPQLLVERAPRPLREVMGGEAELPEPLAELISTMLEKDPQRRPRNTRRVRQVLRTVLLSLPMSATNTLAREARPCFRPESPEDIPPLIPETLGQQGRSALPLTGTRAQRLRQRWSALRWPARAAMGLALLTGLGVPLGITLSETVTPVRFTKPQTSIVADVELPPEVSHAWLVREVKHVLRDEVGNVRIVGPVGAEPRTVLYAYGEPRNWNEASEQIIHLALRCVEGLCVFAITREVDGARVNRQGTLFPDMALQQWREIIRDTTVSLYR
jgi:serine/threonine protein kinase